MKNILFAIITLSFLIGFSQEKKIAPYFLKQDFALFESLLNTHPQLHEYTTSEELSLLIETSRQELEHSLTPLEFYKTLSLITSNIHDANTRLYAGNNIYTQDSFYPILFKPISGSLYADIEDQNIPVGSKLISINNIPADSIITSIKKYAVSDGENETRKFKKIEAYFSLYHYYEFGSSKSYTSIFETIEGELINVTLEGCSFESLNSLNKIRHSYSYKDKQKTNLPYLSYTDDKKVIQLTVNTFGVAPNQFKNELAKLFSLIENEGFKHLIIDIRENEGGYRENAIELMSYISKNDFSQIRSRSIKTKKYPQTQHLINTFSDEDFDAIYTDGLVSRTDSKKHLMTPKHTAFNGQVFVLTSGLNTANASLFAMNAKNEENIQLVGEETGGNYYFHMGGQTIYYQLPNSKIKVVLPTERLVHDVDFGNNPEGIGVVPHHTVEITIEDLVEGFDTQLNYIFDTLIPNSTKPTLVSKPHLPHQGIQAAR